MLHYLSIHIIIYYNVTLIITVYPHTKYYFLIKINNMLYIFLSLVQDIISTIAIIIITYRSYA